MNDCASNDERALPKEEKEDRDLAKDVHGNEVVEYSMTMAMSHHRGCHGEETKRKLRVSQGGENA